jgi:hypothetical protein
LTSKMMTRESEEASQSASPSTSPQHRQRRVPDSPKAPPRQAWTAEGDAPHSSRPGHERRASNNDSRPGTAQRTARSAQGAEPQLSVDWQNHTLFGGEKNTNPRAKRGFATTFRRPSSSRHTPHTRPIFVVGQNGEDPRMCVDMNAPARFGSGERTRYELSWRQAVPDRSNLVSGSRALPERSAATIGNIGKSGPSSTGRSLPMGGGSGSARPPARPSSVNSARPFRGASGPSPLPGQRPPLPMRPMSQQAPRMSSTPVQRGFCSPSPPPPPACWSGA